jgi:P-type conjugative transfer protein TrbJ
MTFRYSASPAVLIAAAVLAVPVTLSPMLTGPAHAQFGFGRIVYDPSNYAQNVLTAARTLEQINNQITSLQNEAQMLINQARNLASLPHSSLQALQQNVQRTQQLLGQAQNIAFEVGQIDQAFQSQYANVSLSATDAQLVADARSRWENTVGGLQDAMRVQAGAVGNIDSNRAEMAALVGQSQGATGALQATQAGNQLLALQSQQLSDLIAVISANGRADALTEAERATAAEQGRIQRERFLTPVTGYQPATRRCSTATTDREARHGRQDAGPARGRGVRCDCLDSDRNRHGAEGRAFRATTRIGPPIAGRSAAHNLAPLPAARRGGGKRRRLPRRMG